MSAQVVMLCTDFGVPALGCEGSSVHLQNMVRAFTTIGYKVALVAASLLKKGDKEKSWLPGKVLHYPRDRMRPWDKSAIRTYLERLQVRRSDLGCDISLEEAIHMTYNERMIPRLLKLVQRLHPTFIYERASLYGISGAIVAETTRTKLLLEVNNPLMREARRYHPESPSALGWLAESAALRAADVVMPVSQRLVKHVRTAGVEARRIAVLRNQVDCDMFCPSPGNASRTDGPLRLGFVGGMRPWHDVLAIARLFQRLVARHANLELVVVGDGPQLPKLVEDLVARRVMDRCRVLGKLLHKDVAPVMRTFDVGLVPYAHDDDDDFYFSPLKLFEYMASGVAVIAARLGQITEVIHDGVTGIFYEPGNDDSLFAACERLILDAELRRRIGHAARQGILSQYSWKRNARTAVELARSLPPRTR